MRGVFFGLEYDNDAIPNAIVVPGTRSGKFVKWVQEYNPTWITREDGKQVLRERRVVQLPMHYNLRKDEVKGAMKRNKTENYQDGKFFVVEAHAIGVHIHPVKAKMEKAAKEKSDAGVIAKTSPNGGTQKPTVVKVDDSKGGGENVHALAGKGVELSSAADKSVRVGEPVSGG